jgi:hypothetical protein
VNANASASIRNRLAGAALGLAWSLSAVSAWSQTSPTAPLTEPSAAPTGERDQNEAQPAPAPAGEPADDPAAAEQRKEAVAAPEPVNPPGTHRVGKAKPSRGKVEKRQVPDYDGHPNPTTVGDVALWVPRLVLSPLYLLHEYVIRRPIGTLVTAAERSNLPKELYDFFTFGDDHKAGIVPIAFYDFGFYPSVGLYLFWDDVFVKGHDLRLHGSTWTGGWLALVLQDRIHLGKESTLEFEAALIKRPDFAFYGIGPNTLQEDRSRYSRTLLDGSVSYELRMWRSSKLETRIGVKRATIGDGRFRNDPTLSEESAKGTFPLPPGFDDAYTAEYQRAHLAIDSRHRRPGSGSGVRVEAGAEHGTQINSFPGAAWLRYAFNAAAFYDLNGHNRVLSLSATALFSDPVGSGQVPFTELISLGGDHAMRGYWPGRLIDRSAAVLTAGYKWPVWGFLDGTLDVAVGNVFGERLESFDPKLFRLSSTIGFSTVNSPDSTIEVLFGIGTETFDSGARVSSFRLVFGASRGF